MLSLDRELDSKAKSNPSLFWKDLKKRKLRQEPYCAGIDFDGVKVRDPDQIRDGWANYFEKLYTPNDGSFDSDWKRFVNNNVDNCYTNLRLLVDREAQVEQSIKLLPKGKAGGIDRLKYEHLIYSCQPMSICLANMFTFMLRASYVPKTLQRGVITTIHKGGNKRKDSPDNYRDNFVIGDI